jgi:hypothetical protein
LSRESQQGDDIPPTHCWHSKTCFHIAHFLGTCPILWQVPSSSLDMSGDTDCRENPSAESQRSKGKQGRAGKREDYGAASQSFCTQTSSLWCSFAQSDWWLRIELTLHKIEAVLHSDFDHLNLCPVVISPSWMAKWMNRKQILSVFSNSLASHHSVLIRSPRGAKANA